MARTQTGLNLLSGLAQGYAQGRQNQITQEFRQKEIKLSGQKHQRELEEADQLKAAKDRFSELIRSMGADITPTANPADAAAGFADPAPQKGQKLSEMMADSEFLAAGLKAESLQPLLGVQSALQKNREFSADEREAAADRQQDERALDIREAFARKFGLTDGGGGVSPGDDLGFRPKQIRIDKDGNPVFTFESTRSEQEDVVKANNLKEMMQGVEEVEDWLKIDPGKELSIDNIDGVNIAFLVTGWGEGTSKKTNLYNAGKIIFETAGKNVTENELPFTMNTMLPTVEELVKAGLGGALLGGVSAGTAAAKGVVVRKMQRMKQLLAGAMSPEEMQKVINEGRAAMRKAAPPLDGGATRSTAVEPTPEVIGLSAEDQALVDKWATQ